MLGGGGGGGEASGAAAGAGGEVLAATTGTVVGAAAADEAGSGVGADATGAGCRVDAGLGALCARGVRLSFFFSAEATAGGAAASCLDVRFGGDLTFGVSDAASAGAACGTVAINLAA